MEQSYKERLKKKYNELLPSIKELEPKRKKMLFLGNLLVFFGYSICTFVTIVFLFYTITVIKPGNMNVVNIILSYLAIFCAVSAMFSIMMKIFSKKGLDKNFANSMKKICFESLIEVFDFIKVSPNKEFSFCSMYQRLIGRKGGVVETNVDDCFEGCYKDVKFSITEVSDIMMRGKMGVYSGPWGGVILKMQFNKGTKSDIYLSPKSEYGVLLGVLIGTIITIVGLFGNFLIFLFGAVWTGLLTWTLICRFKQYYLYGSRIQNYICNKNREGFI